MNDTKQNKKDPLEEDRFLKMHLNSYHIDIPDIPLKKSKKDRLIQYLASPASNPFDGYVNNLGGLVSLTVSPIIIGTILFILQIIRFMM